MHLALAATSQGSRPGSPNSSASWPSGPDEALIRGIAAYRRHPWSRDVVDPPAAWREGETQLLDHGGETAAPALLLIPSLINRASILDLSRDRSMARSLAAAGLRVFLLDWGWPDADARQLDLDKLITGRLARAVDHAAAMTEGPITLVGYCMGGLLAAAAAQLQRPQIAGLALLATPWDFHASPEAPLGQMARLTDLMEPMMNATGTLSVDALQMLFNVADPHSVGDRYRAFGATDQDSDRARQFVAIEDWLNDGVPLAAPLARQCLRDWYGANTPANGLWKVAGQVIAPHTLRLPSFVAIPGRDRIVPPESAAPLAEALPDAVVVRPAAGHVGMVAGATARAALWSPLAAWARAIPRPPAFPKRPRKANVAP